MMGAPGSTSTPAGEPNKVALVHTAADALLSTSQRNHLGPVLPPPSREGGFRPAAVLGQAAVGAGASTPSAPPAPEIATLQVCARCNVWCAITHTRCGILALNPVALVLV